MLIRRFLFVLAIVLSASAVRLPAQPAERVPDAHTRVLVHFESPADVADPAYIHAGHARVTGEGAAFVEGRFGQGLDLAAKGVVSFPCPGGNFPGQVGTVEMWLKPTQPWKGWETPFMRGGTTWDEWGQNSIDVHFGQPNELVMTISGKGGSLRVEAPVGDWPAGQWRHLALCWDLPNGKAAIYLDGQLAGEATGEPFHLPDSTGDARVNARGGNPMNAVIDELRVSDVWRYPGSGNEQGEPVEPPPADRPLNDDPGFETAELGTLAEPNPAWNRGEGTRDATWELVADNPHGGRRCLKVTQPVAGRGKAITSTREGYLPAEAGRTYSFTAWLRADEPGIEARLALGTELWYHRQVVVRPTAEWQPYTVTWTLPAKQGNRLVARVENWGPGALYIDDAAVHEVDASADAEPDPLVVDAAAPRGEWPAVHAGTDSAIIVWQCSSFTEETVSLMKAAGITHVRYTVLCPAHNLTPAEGEWDWRVVDRHLELLHAAGIEPILAFHNTPQWMSRDGTADTPPKDFEAWGEVVREIVRHVNVEKGFGVEYFEVWNEPDLPFWKDGTPEEFCELYEVFVRAVRSVEPGAKVGGPATSGSGAESGMVYRGAPQWKYLRAFIRHCGQNELPLDFLSFHRYDLDPAQVKLSCEELRGWVQQYPHMRDAELFVSEWNFTPGRGKGPVDRNANASYAAAWIAGAIDGSLDRATFFDFADAAWPAPGTLLHAELGLVATDGTPKPVYNAIRLWSWLDDTRLLTTGGTPETGAFATRGPEAVSVLVYNHAGPTRRTLRIENLPFEGSRVRVERSLVDARNANAHALWERIGPPEKLPPQNPAAGAFSQAAVAAELTGEGWSTEGAGYRGNAPTGCSDNVLVARDAGSAVEWPVDVPAAGTYTLWLKLDCTYYGGVLEVSLDGAPAGRIDTFMDGLDMRWFPVRLEGPSAGRHIVRLTVTDAISPKLGWRHPRQTISVDRLVLTDDAAFAPRPLGGGTEAQAGLRLHEDAALKPQAFTMPLPDAGTIEIPLELTDHSVMLLRFMAE